MRNKNLVSWIICIITIILLSSCEWEDREIDSPTKAEGYPIKSIAGPTTDWQEVEQYDGTLGVTKEFVKKRQKPVGSLQWNDVTGQYKNPGDVSNARWCTGTMISENLFLTAGHCFDVQKNDGISWDFPIDDSTGKEITPARAAEHMHVDFNFQVDADGNNRTEESFQVEELVEYRLGKLDYAILRLEGTPGKEYSTTPLSPRVLNGKELLTIIQHPASQRKKVHTGEFNEMINSNLIGYNTIDTRGGSSGSGVLDRSGYIVGVHIRAGGNLDYTGNNKATFLKSIYEHSPIVKELSKVVTTYEHSNYKGNPVSIPVGIYNTSNLKELGIKNDNITSLKIPPGLKVTIYEHSYYRGKSKVFYSSDSNLVDNDMNDQLSSIIIEYSNSDQITVFKDSYYRKNSASLPVGNFNHDDMIDLGIENDDITSLIIPNGLKVTLFEHANFSGKSIVLYSSDVSLVDNGMNDDVSSVKVEEGENNCEKIKEAIYNQQGYYAFSWNIDDDNLTYYKGHCVVNITKKTDNSVSTKKFIYDDRGLLNADKAQTKIYIDFKGSFFSDFKAVYFYQNNKDDKNNMNLGHTLNEKGYDVFSFYGGNISFRKHDVVFKIYKSKMTYSFDPKTGLVLPKKTWSDTGQKVYVVKKEI